MKINENKLAKQVVDEEGGKAKVNVAQVKEVLRCTLDILAQEYEMSEVVALIEKHKISFVR